MADDSESLITEIVEETTGDEGLLPSARPRGRLYSLNSSRLPTDVIKRIAVELRLPGTASRADTYPMLEGKLEGLGHEPRNVQVRLDEDSIELMDAEGGVFLQIEVPAEEDPAEEDGHEGSGDLRAQLDEACSLNECLRREVSELKIRLAKANTKVKELWGQQCTLLVEFDEQLAEAEAKIEHLRAAGTGSPLSITGEQRKRIPHCIGHIY